MHRPIGLKLGSLTLDVPFFQASLSGYSDYIMRALARRYGCPFTMADVILAKSAVVPHVLRKACFRPGPDEHPVGAQILGEDRATMARAARDLVEIGYDLIDINCACPAPKVLRRARGGALLEHPNTVIEILKAVRDAVQCPVLMKLRVGMNNSPGARDDFWEIVTRSIDHSVDALVIHGRTVSQRYRGRADWSILASVKRRFPNAIIVGSGDVFDPPAAIELLRRTGLDGLIVARGAIGNPWIFRELRCVWEDRPLPPPPDLAEQRLVMLEHLDGLLPGCPEKRIVGHFRKFAVHYARPHPSRKQVQAALLRAATRAEVKETIDAWYSDGIPTRLERGPKFCPEERARSRYGR